MIQELSSSLENKDKACNRLEKKVKELEGTLSLTNEKRFKLQDTIGNMEKELQNTKAHINKMADMHPRYAPGMQPIYSKSKTREVNFSVNQNKMRRSRKRFTENILRASIENMNIIRKRISNLTTVTPYAFTHNTDYLRVNCLSSRNKFTKSRAHTEEFMSHCGDYLSNKSKEKISNTNIPSKNESLQEFINHARRISQFDLNLDKKALNSQSPYGWDYSVPVSTDVNSILIARDVVSHSLSKIRQDIENSILLVSKSRLSD